MSDCVTEGRAGLREVAEAMQAGRLSSRDLVERAIEAYCARETELHAFIRFDAEGAREEARVSDDARARLGSRGYLQGIPVSVKDHFGVERLPTWAGMRRELPERFRGEGPVVATLRRQCAVVMGKTLAVELAFGGLGTNPHHGTPRNPWDSSEHRVPGGSSAGAGVSLWQGAALLALGTDTAGSCRIPAAWTGTVGLKTTKGRWSTDGIVPLSSSLDTVGLLVRSVEDAIIAFAALDPELARQTPPPATLARCAGASPPRLGVVREQLWEGCSPGVAEAVEEALSTFARSGVTVREAALPEARAAEELLRSGSVVSAELDAFLERELPERREEIEPTVASRIADGGGIPAREYLARRRRIQDLGQAAHARFEQGDVLVFPAVPNSPPTLAALGDLEAYRRENFLALRNTCVANFLGLCALSLPIGRDSLGMPVGMGILAPRGEELRLLGAALALERRLGDAESLLGWPPGISR
ncbi:MAG: amidase [Polyangia bacterium]|jgi:aspartyl-tRNA(Asn)/glutamyl-tRNA(Gln) amidotransferase subunit A|nr:amidase [Polyangia bacterium]